MYQTTLRADCNTQALARIRAFSGLSVSERGKVADRCKCRRYVANEVIISPLDTSRDVFFIVSGSVQAMNFLPSGHQIVLQSVEAGEMFGELSALDGAPRSAYVVAADECLLVFMSAQDFHHIQQRFPAVNAVLIKRLVYMVRHLSTKVSERDALPARDRIRLHLLRRSLIDRQENHNVAVIAPAPTHNEIAAHASTSRETVTRELSHLAKIGVIRRQNRSITVLDIIRLNEMLDSSFKSLQLH